MGPCVAVMAGGTGGHVFPALAVAERLRAEGVAVFWIGTRRGMEARLVPEHGFDLEWIGIEGLRGKGLRTLVLAPFRLALALWQAGSILRRRRPAAVLGMGGFASGPGGLMARMLRVPVTELSLYRMADAASMPPLTLLDWMLASRSYAKGPT